MFYDNELLFLRKIFEKFHIATAVFSADSKISDINIMGRQNILVQAVSEERFYDYFPKIKNNTVCILEDPFKCNYSFMLLPFCEKETIFLIGPYLTEDITREEILEKCEKMNISPENAKRIELMYASLPIFTDENYILSLINSFAEFLWNDSKNYNIVTFKQEKYDLFNNINLGVAGNFNEEEFSIAAMEERYKYENLLIDAVAEGNLNVAQHMVPNFSSLAFESRVADRLRNLKNYGIIMNTLFRKAAERGGVHPVYIDKVSSQFAKEIENAKTFKEINEIMPEILVKYCNLVRKNSTKGYSPAVKKAIIKIESDLTADLSLNEMAKLCNVSSGYLSALFKKETGKTLTDFVNDKRVSFAKHLLKTTNLQVQTIAQHCGILDFHYFCRMFKKSVGLTPTQYREKYLFS